MYFLKSFKYMVLRNMLYEIDVFFMQTLTVCEPI